MLGVDKHYSLHFKSVIDEKKVFKHVTAGQLLPLQLPRGLQRARLQDRRERVLQESLQEGPMYQHIRILQVKAWSLWQSFTVKMQLTVARDRLHTCLGHFGWHNSDRIISICAMLPKLAMARRGWHNRGVQLWIFLIKFANVNMAKFSCKNAIDSYTWQTTYLPWTPWAVQHR